MSTKNQRAFTLLEVLIAMSIFAVVLSMLYMAYTGTFRNIEETESQADLYQMARIVLERMTEDLESVYMVSQKKTSDDEEEVDQPTRFVGTMTETEGRRLDTLRFASKAHIFFDVRNPTPGQPKSFIMSGKTAKKKAVLPSTGPTRPILSKVKKRGPVDGFSLIASTPYGLLIMTKREGPMTVGIRPRKLLRISCRQGSPFYWSWRTGPIRSCR